MAPVLKNLNIPDFYAFALLYILRAIILTSFIGLILLPFVQSKQEHSVWAVPLPTILFILKQEHIVWVVPVYSVLFIHRLITYVSQLI